MAATPMPNAPVIALDTNVLIDLAGHDETVLDCLSTIVKKFPKAPIIVLPTVIGELMDIAKNDPDKESQQLATNALTSIRDPWQFQPINYVPVGHGIVEETARKIRAAGLIPDEEVNDSFIIAEAALSNATILLSSDGHMKDINQQELKEILDGSDVGSLVIFSPHKIVKSFFNKVH